MTEIVDDDICLYRDETNDVAVLNRTAREVWDGVDGRSSADDIVAGLAARYGVPAEQIRADVVRVLDDLLGRGFLVRE